jgi:uncharacterized protein
MSISWRKVACVSGVAALTVYAAKRGLFGNNAQMKIEGVMDNAVTGIKTRAGKIVKEVSRIADSGKQLRKAARQGELETVKALVRAGVHVDSKNEKSGDTPLIKTVKAGHQDVAKFLIGEGADVNATNRRGKTALMRAAKYGHSPIVETLLAASADVNARTLKGKSAVSYAADKGHRTVVEILQQAGAAL